MKLPSHLKHGYQIHFDVGADFLAASEAEGAGIGTSHLNFANTSGAGFSNLACFGPVNTWVSGGH